MIICLVQRNGGLAWIVLAPWYCHIALVSGHLVCKGRYFSMTSADGSDRCPNSLRNRQRRSQLAGEIRQNALAWSVAWADAAEIDHLNILEATFLAMRRAILGLRIQPHFVQVDGNRLPKLTFGADRIEGEDRLRRRLVHMGAPGPVARLAEAPLLLGAGGEGDPGVRRAVIVRLQILVTRKAGLIADVGGCRLLAGAEAGERREGDEKGASQERPSGIGTGRLPPR